MTNFRRYFCCSFLSQHHLRPFYFSVSLSLSRHDSDPESLRKQALLPPPRHEVDNCGTDTTDCNLAPHRSYHTYIWTAVVPRAERTPPTPKIHLPAVLPCVSATLHCCVFPPINVQQSQCPCRCLFQEGQALWSQNHNNTNDDSTPPRSISQADGVHTGRGANAKRCVYSIVVVVLTLTCIIKSVVTGQAPVTLELRNTPRKNTNNPRWYTHIIKIKIHSSCEIEDFVETHLCKLCVILRSRALRVVCPH